MVEWWRMNVSGGSSCVVTFEGTKFYWRTRNTIDVCIVEHKTCNVFELIVYEPSFDVEAPRIYLDGAVFSSRIDHTDIEAKLSFAKRNNVPLTEKFVTGIYNRAYSDYILNRLVMKEFLPEERKIVVMLQFTSGECEAAAAGGTPVELLICEKPAKLEPYRTSHYKSLLDGVVTKALEAFQQEKKSLQEHCDQAMQLQTQAKTSTTLSVREKWRIPLVMGKVARGERLSVADAKIYSTVKEHIHTEADAERVANLIQGLDPHQLMPQGKSFAAPTKVTPKNTRAQSPKRVTVAATSPRSFHTISSRSKSASNDEGDCDKSAKNRKVFKKVGKSPKARKSVKKSGKSPKARGRPSGVSIISTASTEDGTQFGGCESGEDDEAAEMENTLSRMMAGIVAIGTSIKASFSFSSRISPVDEHAEFPEGEPDPEDSLGGAAGSGSGSASGSGYNSRSLSFSSLKLRRSYDVHAIAEERGGREDGEDGDVYAEQDYSPLGGGPGTSGSHSPLPSAGSTSKAPTIEDIARTVSRLILTPGISSANLSELGNLPGGAAITSGAGVTSAELLDQPYSDAHVHEGLRMKKPKRRSLLGSVLASFGMIREEPTPSCSRPESGHVLTKPSQRTSILGSFLAPLAGSHEHDEAHPTSHKAASTLTGLLTNLVSWGHSERVLPAPQQLVD